MDFKKKLWVEDYRPSNIDECVLPERLKSQIKTSIEGGSIQNLLLSGIQGSGKTTLARAICNELGADYMLINGSEENGIDILRTRVKSFASTVSLTSDAHHKIIIFDEADYLSSASQPALRGIMESVWENCRFIFTCNYLNRILPALQSRCSVIEFSYSTEEKKQMMTSFFKRASSILKENDIEFEPKVLAEYIKSRFPDFRSILNELQRYSEAGKIDEGILRMTGDAEISEIVEFLRKKEFNVMRKWVDSNSSLDVHSLFDSLYEKMPEFIKPQSIPDLVLIVDEYQDKATRAVNQKINLAACMTTMMASLEFK